MSSELIFADGSKYKIYSCCYSGLHLIVLDHMAPILWKLGLLDQRDFNAYRTIARRCISWSYGDEIASKVVRQQYDFDKEINASQEPLTSGLKRLKKQYRI